MLTVKNLNQYYGGSHILRDLSFEVPSGKVTVLLGRNGVGKTTLLKTLMGLVPAKSGAITFGERDITAAAPYERARAGLGYVPQGRDIFPRLTVAENLDMGLATLPRGALIPERIHDMFPVLRQMMKRRGGEMAILLCEQYYDFARSLADQYLVMERGEIIARGAGADMDKNDVRGLLAV